MRSCPSLVAAVSVVLLAFSGCNAGPKDTRVHPEPKASAAPASPAARTVPEGALRLGSPIEASAEKVSLTEVAKSPNAFIGKRFATAGTVTAVCQHMGCWMELKDDGSEAHIKMAGHSFFVPKNAAGRRARVLATLLKNDEDGACAEGTEGMAAAGGASSSAAPTAETHAKGKGCKAEAEAQLGRPLAKMELVAEGVELL